MKLQMTKGNQFFLNLPRALVRAKKWKKGKELFININKEGNLIILEGKEQ